MGIQRYMFFSIHNCDKHPEVPLMQMKTCTEQYLKESGLNYTIFRLCGFMQVMPLLLVLALCMCTDTACVSGDPEPICTNFCLDQHINYNVLASEVKSGSLVQAIIGNYAVPILEDKQVWGTSDDTRTAYLDSQDVARMALAALRYTLFFTACYSCYQLFHRDFWLCQCHGTAQHSFT